MNHTHTSCEMSAMIIYPILIPYQSVCDINFIFSLSILDRTHSRRGNRDQCELLRLTFLADHSFTVRSCAVSDLSLSKEEEGEGGKAVCF